MRIGNLRLAANKIGEFIGLTKINDRLAELYLEKDYLEAYSRHTDLRVVADPRAAIGGMWDEIGQLQFDFLIMKGLQPQHRLLDIGCGTLRGGRHFIRYLEPGNYCGTDISLNAIAAARHLVQRENLSGKYPRLITSENKDLQFRDFSGQSFDYVLAQSVFSHLKPEHIEECFLHIGKVMKETSVFYFTYNDSPDFRQLDLKDFGYPFSFFQSLAEQNGFEVKDCSAEYDHPRGQCMVELRWASTGGKHLEQNSAGRGGPGGG